MSVLSIAVASLLAAQCAPAVAPGTLLSIAHTESGLSTLVIHDNDSDQDYQPASPREAARLTQRLVSRGHSVDTGIMQINSRNFASLGLTAESAFDPCRSMAAAAVLLVTAYQQCRDGEQACIRRAASIYNTGNAQAGFYNGYVHKVEHSARVVVPEITVDLGEAAKPPPSPHEADRCPAHRPSDDWHVDSACEQPDGWHTQASDQEGVHR